MMNSRPTKRFKMPRGPFRGLREFLGRLFESKRFMMLVSLLVAILAWSALVASDGTLTREKVFSNVAVSVTGESTLKSRGYIVMDDIQELVPGVRMTVEVTQQNYNRVSGTSYNPHFDLSKIKGEGENVLTVSYSSQLYGPVIKCEPSSVTVNVERYMTRRVPVAIEVVGENPEGVYLDGYKTDPTMLSVSGPQSLVLSVARAVARLDRSALSAQRMNDRTALIVELQNSIGEAIISDKLEITNQTVITDSVVVDTELIPAKAVPLALDSFVTGEPAEGFELAGVLTEETALTVAAKQEALDSMEYIVAEQPIDITGAGQDVSGYVKIKRLSGVENTLPAEMAVTAQIREKTVERTIRGVAVDMEGLAAGQTARLSHDQVTVQLTGGYRFISDLKKEDIRLFVDAGGLDAGTHVLPVQIRIDNAQEFACALSESEVVVEIAQSAEETVAQ